jgi:outer membrane biosynthesis protein TonB
MDTDKIVGDVAETVRDLVARTLSQAEERAGQIIDAAENEAKSVLDRAHEEAAEIRRKAESDAESRLSSIQAALKEVQANIGIGGEVPTSPVPEPEPEPPVIPEPTPPAPDPVPSPEPVPEPEPPLIPEPTPPPDEATPPQVAARPSPSNGKSNDDAGARLVAMNMALEGATRDQARSRIEAEYDCADLDGLIEDIFSRVPAKG